MVAVQKAVIAIQSEELRRFVIISNDDSAIAPDIERFQGMHAEGVYFAERAGKTAVYFCANGRAGVLHNRDTVAIGDFENLAHFRRTTGPVNWEYCRRF